MGEKKNITNILIIAILVFLVVIQFFNPFRKKEGPSAFDETFEKANATLDRFERLNDSLRMRTDSLKMARLRIDSVYDQKMPDYTAALNRIEERIKKASADYSRLLAQLNAEKDRFNASGAPDSIPNIEDLRLRKYATPTPN